MAMRCEEEASTCLLGDVVETAGENNDIGCRRVRARDLGATSLYTTEVELRSSAADRDITPRKEIGRGNG